MNEPSEATHYQIELTSRQVLSALLVLVICLFAAFFAGVWIGRGSGPSPASLDRSAELSGPASERYEFFEHTELDPEARAASAPAGDAATGDRDSRPADLSDLEVPAPAGASSSDDRPFPEQLLASDGRDQADELPPPEEMGRGGRRRRVAAALTAGEEPEADSDQLADRPAIEPATERDTTGTAPSAAAPAPTAEGGFHIQVLATTDRDKAQALVDRLVDADFKAFLAPSSEGGRTVYRVRVGPFPDRALASRQAEELERRWGLDSWISPGPP